MHIAILTFEGFNELDSLIALEILTKIKKPGWRVTRHTTSVSTMKESETVCVASGAGFVGSVALSQHGLSRIHSTGCRHKRTKDHAAVVVNRAVATNISMSVKPLSCLACETGKDIDAHFNRLLIATEPWHCDGIQISIWKQDRARKPSKSLEL